MIIVKLHQAERNIIFEPHQEKRNIFIIMYHYEMYWAWFLIKSSETLWVWYWIFGFQLVKSCFSFQPQIKTQTFFMQVFSQINHIGIFYNFSYLNQIFIEEWLISQSFVLNFLTVQVMMELNVLAQKIIVVLKQIQALLIKNLRFRQLRKPFVYTKIRNSTYVLRSFSTKYQPT